MNVSVVQIVMESLYNLFLALAYLELINVDSVLPHLTARVLATPLINIGATPCKASVKAPFQISCGQLGGCKA